MIPAPLLVFDRENEVIHLLNGKGATSWLAANNAARSSKGPWPEGVFEPQRIVSVGGIAGERGGEFGPWFIRYFVEGRDGMGIHAGREGDYDLALREGPRHATLGCIRSSADALNEIARAVQGASGQLPRLWVPR